jgi:CxxC-x17-CxxC domain-containing protein
MRFEDKTLTCQDCGKSFTFSADDQAFHAQKGYTNEPKRCPSCRTAKREARGSGGFGGGSRPTFAVKCSACGKDTTVPFQPRGDRPVYCSDCYRQQGGGARRGR